MQGRLSHQRRSGTSPSRSQSARAADDDAARRLCDPYGCPMESQGNEDGETSRPPFRTRLSPRPKPRQGQPNRFVLSPTSSFDFSYDTLTSIALGLAFSDFGKSSRYSLIKSLPPEVKYECIFINIILPKTYFDIR